MMRFLALRENRLRMIDDIQPTLSNFAYSKISVFVPTVENDTLTLAPIASGVID